MAMYRTHAATAAKATRAKFIAAPLGTGNRRDYIAIGSGPDLSSPLPGVAAVGCRLAEPEREPGLFRYFGCLQHDALTRVLLQDREQSRVQEPDLKEHQERD